MTHLALVIIGSLFAMLAFVPGTPAPSSSSAIPPLVWELTELTKSAGAPSKIVDPARYTVQFLPAGRLAIGADCNAATGTYTIDGHALDIKLGASTLALCPPDSQAEPYLGVLEQVTSFAFDDDGQLMLEGDAGSLLFRPTLLGVVWEWQDFRGSDDSRIAPKDPRQYTVSFLPDGKLAIKADCNRAIGAYAVDGPKIDLTIGGVTRALCPPGTLMFDFLRDLGYASSHVFRNGNLYLALPADAGIMAFKALYVEPATATPESG
jgi:heat shock protein HslJ